MRHPCGVCTREVRQSARGRRLGFRLDLGHWVRGIGLRILARRSSAGALLAALELELQRVDAQPDVRRERLIHERHIVQDRCDAVEGQRADAEVPIRGRQDAVQPTERISGDRELRCGGQPGCAARAPIMHHKARAHRGQRRAHTKDTDERESARRLESHSPLVRRGSSIGDLNRHLGRRVQPEGQKSLDFQPGSIDPPGRRCAAGGPLVEVDERIRLALGVRHDREVTGRAGGRDDAQLHRPLNGHKVERGRRFQPFDSDKVAANQVVGRGRDVKLIAGHQPAAVAQPQR